MWRHLTKRFPEALASVLMPNHLHLVLPDEAVPNKLTGLLGAFSKKSNIPRLWQPIPPPTRILDPHHLRRQLRYIALNPCRKELCRDPLEWEWSSYRDILGATSNPWITARQLCRALNESERGFGVRFHSYVSGDPSVAIQGTPFPKTAPPQILTKEPILDIVAATTSALKVPTNQIEKHHHARLVFVHLAHRQGWKNNRLLAKMCKITPRAVQIMLHKPTPDLGAAALCLGDERLRRISPTAKLHQEGLSP